MPSAELRSGEGPPTPWPGRFGRVQQGDRLRLGLRNLYILPTGFGTLWLAGAGLLQVVGIQTQRNGPLLLSFLMLALMLLALHLTHFNLQGLELSCGSPRPGFADEPLLYPVQLQSTCRREAVVLHLEGQPATAPLRLRAGSSQLGLSWRCSRRGHQPPGTLVIQSRAPLGLFVCWSRWRPAGLQVVYPARRQGPVGLAPGPAERQLSRSQESSGREGSEHWRDLRPHRPEDSQTRLAWKALAQGRGRLTKVFDDPGTTTPRLTPAGGIPREQALQHLSDAVWRHSQRGDCFGLELPGTHIAPGRGREHRDRCLLALALLR
jgi:uncharacterized protein (DUF58 family)